MKNVLLVLGLGLMLNEGAQGEDLYVPLQYNTIQAAIDEANTGDTVWVSDGTYTGTGNKNLTWSGKKITVRSVSGPENCIIDCQNSGRGFYFNNAGDCGTISGFTITRGSATYGGGIYCGSSFPTITNNIIVNNGDYGIYCYDSTPIINYNNVWNNSPANYYSCSPQTGNISADPCFISSNDFHLQASSPCIDAGSNTAPGIHPTDKDGNPRIGDGNNDGQAIVDYGSL